MRCDLRVAHSQKVIQQDDFKPVLRQRQAVSRVREAEKESEAVRHNQAECRQYLAAGEAAGTGETDREVMQTVRAGV